jgi:hypothetical protein
MTTNETRRLTTAALIFFMLASQETFAGSLPKSDPVQEMESRMDRYFSVPRSPETFRALSGMGLPAGATAKSDDQVSRWLSAGAEEKELLHSLFPGIDVSGSYADFGACRLEAPMQQFKARVTQWGAQHPYVAQWVRVEQAVLSVCAPGRNKNAATALPPPLEVAEPAVALWQKQDRTYQQGAMLFYQGDHARALAAFQAIASDRTSPNRPLAAYMVLALRAGSYATSTADSIALSPQDAVQAIAAIHAVLADSSLQDIHAMAASLIGWIGANVADGPTRDAQVREAISALMTSTGRFEHGPELLKRYEAALSDIDFLHSNFPNNPDWVLTGDVPASYTASAALADLAKHEPMAAWVDFPTNAYHRRAWVLAATMPESAVVRAYLDRMGANGADPRNPWLHESPDASAKTLSGLVDDELARLKVNIADEQATAALGLDYYNLTRRLLMDTNDRHENFKVALQRLERFPYKSTATFGRAVDDGLQYLITEGRLAEARQIRDALKLDEPEGDMRFTSSAGALLILAEDEDHLVRVLATESSYPREYVNHFSTAELWRLADRSELDRGQRALFVRAAWSRDYALARTISRQHDQLLRVLMPEITGTWQASAGGDVKPDDISVVQDVLKSPGLNTVIEDFSRMPDGKDYQATATLTGMDHFNHNDNNWWCAWDVARHDAALDDTLARSFGLDDEKPEVRHQRVHDLLTAALPNSYLFRKIDEQELVDLSKVKSAPQFLSERVVAWVSGTGLFGSRAGQAEALADAVLSTRWGCERQGGHLASSRAAFKLLHTLFAETPAAKRTTYWFK